MKAYVAIQNFGDIEDKQALCEHIKASTMFHAYIDDRGNILMPCKVAELGWLFGELAGFRETNWVEYTVQFDC